MGAPASRRPRTIRSLWTRLVTGLLVVVIGLGAVSLAAAQFQRHAFEETTGQYQSELRAITGVAQELRTIDVAMTSIFYGFGDRAQLEAHVVEFEHRRAAIDAAFDVAARTVPVRGDTDELASARTAWGEIAAMVATAPELWGTTVVVDALAAGEDPYADAWQRLRDAQGDLTDLTAESVADLRAHAAAVGRIQAFIPPVIVLAVLLTVTGGWVASRRITRRIVAPVQQLRDTARAMQAGDLTARAQLDRPVVELDELDAAMGDLATSLDSSHGQLRDQAVTDVLTGLPNRKGIMDHLERRIGAQKAEGLALLFIDLDDFKTVNDTMGHAAGDQMLDVVARRLRGAARDSELVGRLGGDEFAVIIDAAGDPAHAHAVAERILEAFREPVALDHGQMRASCSIGLAFLDAQGASTGELLRNADIAMYMAKSRGKHCLEQFAPTMHTEMLARLTLKSDLARAAAHDELVLHYQPVVDVATQRVQGYEALVRWQHPVRGLLAPADFIPMAEDTGDIVAIGQWVLDRACLDHTASLAGTVTPVPWVSVNVSAHQLQHDGFTALVHSTLERHAVAPDRLVLEITEAALVTDTVRVAAVIESLQRSGVRIALDDFGTGFSSLRYLQDLPVDIIKIDRSFLAVKQGHVSSSLLDSLVTLGKSLGLGVIAEGIELETELERLQAMGNVAGQGYHIARPQPLAQVVTYEPAARLVREVSTP